ncbi:MAG TPA: hypothetical protein VG148_00685, partial [Pyrinomonadaceae bacterium]|nr:hypothetical protein [Pyrinomonadaceae bacterium]
MKLAHATGRLRRALTLSAALLLAGADSVRARRRRPVTRASFINQKARPGAVRARADGAPADLGS